MPDISRSDSNRSDASRPRVSFNRDVHVKRINGPRTANAYSLSPDGSAFVPTSVRRERPMTKKEMTKEAEAVLKQVDKVSCTATSNMDAQTKKATKKRRKNSFSFLKKTEKLEKSKNSSSDVDSGSSQEYRVYKVNSPIDNNNSININENNNINKSEEFVTSKNKRNEKTFYDFMSLDRKKLKREKKNKNLEYLSLEKTNEILGKMKKEKQNKTLISMMFDKIDGKNKKAGNEVPKSSTGAEANETGKSKPKISLDFSDEKVSKKKQLSPIIENPGSDYFSRKMENNVEKMVKKLTEKNVPKLTKNTGPIGVKEPRIDMCHNDNKPFSYTSGDRGDSGPKLDETKGLGHGREVYNTASPTSDVIYAQVIIGGRDGNAQKPTVNERVASNEVGRVFVGDESNQSQVGLNYKIDSDRNDCVCEIVTEDGDEMWQAKSEHVRKKEKPENSKMLRAEFYREEPSGGDVRRPKSTDGEAFAFPDSACDNFTRVIRVASKYEPSSRGNKSPTDLRDLSMRREILLSRSESQAKERFNSLKRLQEPARIKRHVSSVNGIRPGDKISKNDALYLGDDIRINEKFSTSPRKIPKDVELVPRQKRESKPDAHLEEKGEKWNGEKFHVIQTEDDDNLLQKLSKVGKSKSFKTREKPKNKRMEKVKMLFKKKREGKSSESEDDPLASRYTEYRGSDLETSDRSADSSPRRTTVRSEASPSENALVKKPSLTSATNDQTNTLTKIKNEKNKASHWSKPPEKIVKGYKQKSKTEDMLNETTNSLKPSSLRFFGDTDQESTTNENELPDLKTRYGLYRTRKISDSDEERQIVPGRPDSRMTDSTLKGSTTEKFKSKYDLDRPDYGLKQMNHGLHMSNKHENFGSNLSDSSTIKNDSFDLNGLRYGLEVTRSLSPVPNVNRYVNKEKLRQMKSTPARTVKTVEEPLSRKVKSYGNLLTQDDSFKSGRRRMYDSSAESATEGDSSQHSSKSMIYLHAATVGDIPGPRNIYKSDKRSQSREELSSLGNGPVSSPTKKTLSRSISVLAPWRPKHNKEDRTLHYDSATDYYKGKPPTGVGKNKRNSSRETKASELRFNTIGKENRRRKDLLR